jgi:hypothetical protein
MGNESGPSSAGFAIGVVAGFGVERIGCGAAFSRGVGTAAGLGAGEAFGIARLYGEKVEPPTGAFCFGRALVGIGGSRGRAEGFVSGEEIVT